MIIMIVNLTHLVKLVSYNRFSKIDVYLKTKHLPPVDIYTGFRVNNQYTYEYAYMRFTSQKLNKTRECRFRVHVNVILNIQTEFDNAFSSSKVVTCSRM